MPAFVYILIYSCRSPRLADTLHKLLPSCTPRCEPDAVRRLPNGGRIGDGRQSQPSPDGGGGGQRVGATGAEGTLRHPPDRAGD